MLIVYFVIYFRLYAYHDGDGNSCPSLTYIMSGTRVPPTTSTKDTFNKFSSCSLDYFVALVNAYVFYIFHARS